MRIQHNIMAMNAYRNYNNNTSALSSNLEKLSSGYKINRAGDDAAGLAISEKMRAQITGLEAAQKNVKDGVSLVKTAEGAMQEIQDMLNRMDYLATQSANGTYDNEVDRANLQKEVDALKDEINRIADSANFNGIKLLDGSLDSDADLSVSADFTVGNDLPAVGQTLGKDTVLHNNALTDGGTQFDVDLHNFKFDAATGDTMTMKVGDTTFELTATTGQTSPLTGADLANALMGGVTGIDVTIRNGDTAVTSITGGQGSTTMSLEINGQEFEVSAPDRLTDGTNALHFAQKNAPTSKDDEVNGAMEVSLSGVKADVAGKYSISIGTTVNEGDVFNIGGVAVTAAAGQTAGDIANAFLAASASFTDFDVEVSGSTVTLTAKTGGTSTAAPTASRVPAGVATSGTATVAATGAAAVTAVYEITVDATGVTVGGTLINTGNIATANPGAVNGYTVTKDAANNKIILTASVSGVVTAPDAAAAPGAAVSVAGADAVTASYEIDLSDWDGESTVTIGTDELTAAAITAGGNVTVAGSTYTASYSDGTLTLTAAASGADANAATITAANGVKFVKNADPEEAMTVTTVTKPVDGGDIAGITEGSKGDWNVSTTNIKNVTSDGIDRLASTYFTLTEDMAAEGSKIKVGDVEYTFTADKKNLANTAGNFVDISSGDIEQIAKNLTEAAKGNTLYTVGNDGNRMTFTETVTHAGFGGSASYPPDKWDLSTEEGIAKSLGFTAGASSIKSGKALTLQIGDTSDDFNQMKVSVGDMHTKAMGTEGGKSIADIDISTQDGAAEAVNVIKDAINYVSSVRGDLGAIQNRLEHTQNNLSVMAENIQDAESTIRDTDVAEEMMSYVKNNILVQSAQAMLAQANQVPQGVLQLLG